MDNNRQNAYRYLLYHFLLEIRTVPTPNQPDFTDQQIRRRIYFSGAVAYCLHNLALAAANDFIDFNEEHFWQGIRGFSSTNPAIDLSQYHQVFEQRLSS